MTANGYKRVLTRYFFGYFSGRKYILYAVAIETTESNPLDVAILLCVACQKFSRRPFRLHRLTGQGGASGAAALPVTIVTHTVDIPVKSQLTHIQTGVEGDPCGA